MNFDEARKRYENDVTFHMVVDALYSVLYENKLTVGELRDAAMFTGFKFESEHISPTFVSPNFKPWKP